MKKIILLLVLCISMLLAACGNNKEESKTDDSQIDSTQNKEEAPAEPSIESIDDIVEYYHRKGMTAEITTDKYAEIIGAKDGAGVEINNQTVEIYEFDPSSDVLKTVKETNALLDSDALYNGNFVLIGYENNEEAEEILDVFRSFNPEDTNKN